MCLKASTIMTLHRRAVSEHGGVNSGSVPHDIAALYEYVEDAVPRYDFDEIEGLALAAYQIVKKHPFIDGNKRTAMLLILNCLRIMCIKFTGRPKDLAESLISMAKSDPSKKEDAVRLLAYFIKRNHHKYKP